MKTRNILIAVAIIAVVLIFVIPMMGKGDVIQGSTIVQ
tara:strand:+ start:481 stop:594 length:114 start_codon:yes stop_codon:yes gene_type:complete